MFASFTFGNAEFGTIPATDEQSPNQPEVIIFSPGAPTSGDDGSYF